MRITALVAAASLASSSAHKCQGDSTEACHCLLGCEVFGKAPEKCDASSDKKGVIDESVQVALQTPGNECAGMQCVVRCSKRLDCLDDWIEGRCTNVNKEQKNCNIDCSSSRRGTGVFTFLLAVVLGAVAA
mmetsp:Transcript_10097/g.28225  ORF Transcript_10097/g.28225 Transcript_10097/m.28225 type:complete len:131 (-) Transcript_10097:114-506(-)